MKQDAFTLAVLHKVGIWAYRIIKIVLQKPAKKASCLC